MIFSYSYPCCEDNNINSIDVNNKKQLAIILQAQTQHNHIAFNMQDNITLIDYLSLFTITEPCNIGRNTTKILRKFF